MMTGMAAQEVGLGERVPQMAQTLCVPVLVNDDARLCRGRVFIIPAAC